MDELFNFVDLAGKSTYASGKPPEQNSERAGFIEFRFSQGDWSYLDSYTGHTRSAGQEIVKFQGTIVWMQSYCGGMTSGNTDKAEDTYAFLKAALSQPELSFQSLRGPSSFTKGEWEYRYSQDGNIDNYSGYEEILFKGGVAFFHRAIGGVII